MDKAVSRVTILGFVAVMVCYGLIFLAGCSAPKTWHPSTEEEMRMLMGQTVMEAIHQYRQQTLNPKPHEVPPLEEKLEKERHKV